MRFLPLRFPALAVALAGAVTATSAMAQDAAFDAAAPVAKPSSEVTYEPVNEAIQFGTAWGDRATGAHGTFGTFIANFQTPFHTHSQSYHGVVLEGVMTNPFKDVDADNPAQLEVGSYWYVPADSIHATACVSDTPCRFFFTAEGPFNFDVHEE